MLEVRLLRLGRRGQGSGHDIPEETFFFFFFSGSFVLAPINSGRE